MKTTLYDPFIEWYINNPPNMNNVWLYSDPHFNDEEMKCLRKNYIGDEEQVGRINSKVGKHDTIVFLGDMGDISFIPKIKGARKVLIKGNHDSGTSNYKIKYNITLNGHSENPFDDVQITESKMFHEVYEGVLAIHHKIILSHEPIDVPFALNIHGHDHSSWKEQDGLHLNLCAELIDYTPVSLDAIICSGKLKNIPSIHRITIDNATRKAREKGGIKENNE